MSARPRYHTNLKPSGLRMRHTVVVIGASFGGLAVAKQLVDKNVLDVVLIDRREYVDINFASPNLLVHPGSVDRVIKALNKLPWMSKCRLVQATVTALHNDHVVLDNQEEPIHFNYCVVASGVSPIQLELQPAVVLRY